MRWPPILLDLALVIAVWTVVLAMLRQQRARATAPGSQRAVRGARAQTVAAISATVGVTWFVAWFISDALGPRWLHTLSLPASLLFIAAGAVLSGYAGWASGTTRP